MSSPDTYYKDLQNLGITAWLPRKPLVNAAPTPDWVFDYRFGPAAFESNEAKAVASSASSRPTSKGDARAHLAKLRSVLDATDEGNNRSAFAAFAAFAASPAAPIVDQNSTPEQTSKPVSPADTPSQSNARQALSRTARYTAEPSTPAVSSEPSESAKHTPASASDQEVPRFQMAFMCYGPLLVIDAVPPNAKDGFSPLHALLQQKIVESLGVYEPATDAVAYLRWPLFDRPGIDQSRPEAVKAVKRKLDWVYKKQAPKYVLVMGEAAAQIIYERQEPIHALKGIEFTLKGNEPMVKAYATHSLSEALQLDWVKPEIWADLQPLLRRIKADALSKGSDE